MKKIIHNSFTLYTAYNKCVRPAPQQRNLFYQHYLSQESDLKHKPSSLQEKSVNQIFVTNTTSQTIQNKEITFITGSQSASIPLILNAKIYDLPALIPTGILLKHQIAPFTGELMQGILKDDSVNQQNLSGLEFERFETGVWYASCYGFDPKILKKIKSISSRTLNLHSLNYLSILVLRLLQLEQKKEIKSQARNSIHDLWIEELNTSNNLDILKRLDGILELFNQIKPFKFNSQELDLIYNSFPLVWASTTLKPKDFENGLEGECIVPEKACLGSDIQIVFTLSEKVKKLEKIFQSYGITVLSFEKARTLLSSKKSGYSNL